METVASALGTDLYPERRAFILNATQIAFGVGAAVSPLLGQALLHAGANWRVLYGGLAIGTGLLFVCLLVQPIPATDTAAAAAEVIDLSALRALLKHRPFQLLCLAQAGYVGAELGFFSWMPTYFRENLPEGAKWEGLVVSVFWIAMTLSRSFVAAIAHRIAVVRLIVILSLAAAVAALLTLCWQDPRVVIGFVALTGLCFSGIFSLILAEAGERYPRLAGTVFGGVIAVGGIGGAIFPWLMGIIAETALGWRGGLLLAPILIAGVAGITAALAGQKKEETV
jgi:FHS family glucose/mannose:H+ symporter-like MFS transporter